MLFLFSFFFFYHTWKPAQEMKPAVMCVLLGVEGHRRNFRRNLHSVVWSASPHEQIGSDNMMLMWGKWGRTFKLVEMLRDGGGERETIYFYPRSTPHKADCTHYLVQCDESGPGCSGAQRLLLVVIHRELRFVWRVVFHSRGSVVGVHVGTWTNRWDVIQWGRLHGTA